MTDANLNDIFARTNFAELQETAEAGGWFTASFTGDECVCGEEIDEGDEIRSIGGGEWERRECCG